MNYLINEPPLVLLPTLAEVIGLNEALVLQQMQYWLSRSDKVIDGRRWIYNTYDEWVDQFPFWSKNTIKRTILNLEMRGLVISANHNKAKFDKTKWYTIDYSKLADECTKVSSSKSVSNWAPPRTNLGSPIPDTTTDTTTDTTSDKKNIVEQSTTIPYSEIVDYLNSKIGSCFRASSKKTQSLIKARFKDGFDLQDFKDVIDVKSNQWLKDSKMNTYLRPKTLFGTKFEGYLNESKMMNKSKNRDSEFTKSLGIEVL